MAKMTRSQRRARRQAQADSARARRARRRAPRRYGRRQPPRRRRPARAARRTAGSKRFIVESWGELKKVEWPTQSHVIQGTLVVLIACVIVGTYIWVADIVFKNLVQDVFLR